MLIQAGQSGRGRRFAARWAELVFVNYHALEQAQADYAAFKQQIAEAGRDPEKVVGRRRRLYSRGRDARRGRGQGGADRQRCRRRSTAVAAVAKC